MKCKNCGTPIFIDLPASTAAPAGEAPPAPAAKPAPAAVPSGAAPEAATAQGTIVACAHCGTRYRVPAAAMERPGARLKCSRCGHLFAPPRPEAPKAAPRRAEPAPSPRPAPDFFPSPGGEREGAAEERERPIPLPDQQTIDGMFDDLREQSSPFTPPSTPPAEVQRERPTVRVATEGATAPVPPLREPRPPSPPEIDPEQAYRDATAFDDDLPGLRRERGTVPDEYKYRIFLKPAGAPGAEAGGEAASPAPPPSPPEGAAASPDLGAEMASGADAELDALLAGEPAPSATPPQHPPRSPSPPLARPSPPPEAKGAPAAMNLDRFADALEAAEGAPEPGGESPALADETLPDVQLPEPDWEQVAPGRWAGGAAPVSLLRSPLLGQLLPWFLVLCILAGFFLLLAAGAFSPSPLPTVEASGSRPAFSLQVSPLPPPIG